MNEIDGIDELISLLSGNAGQQETAAQRLIAIGSPAIDPLLTILNTVDKRGAKCAARILGEIGDERVIPALKQALHASNPLVSGAAVESLLKLSPPNIALDLAEMLPHAHIITQQSIIIALQELGDMRVVPLLIPQLPLTETPVMRCAIIKTLGILGDPIAIPAIRSYAQDDDQHVRDWVSIAIEKFQW